MSIVILNWNGKADTVECLDSLKGVAYPDYRTLVVDNASTDGSVEYLRARHPRVEIIENDRNLGFAGGNNTGMDYALEHHAPDFVLFLNNDTTVTGDFLDKLVGAACADDGIGIVGPKVYYYDNKGLINSAGGRMDWPANIGRNIGIREPEAGKYDALREVDYVHGCALLAKATLLRKIGGFDEAYYIYCEDVDLSMRAKNAGYKVVYVPHSVIYHKESSSIKKVSMTGLYYNHRNRVLLLKKYNRRHYLDPLTVYTMLFNGCAAIAYYSLRLDLTATGVILKAYFDGIFRYKNERDSPA